MKIIEEQIRILFQNLFPGFLAQIAKRLIIFRIYKNELAGQARERSKFGKKTTIACICALFIMTICDSNSTTFCQSTSTPSQNLVYAPKNLDKSRRYPALLILSPDGNPRSTMKQLIGTANKYSWILIGDTNFKNGISMNLLYPKMEETIRSAQLSYPIDSQRIYSGGVSGDAMGSYYFAEKRPDLIRGVIANVGMLPYGGEMQSMTGPVPSTFPRNKIVAMLASPTDFRYSAMKTNRLDLEKLGWKVLWIEFQGGHVLAPAACWEQAIAWLSRNH